MSHPSYELPHADMSNQEWISKRNQVEKLISKFIFDQKNGRNAMETQTGLSNQIMNTLVGTVPSPPPVNLQDSIAVRQGDEYDKSRNFPIVVGGEPLSPQEAKDLITDINEHLEYAEKVSK